MMHHLKLIYSLFFGGRFAGFSRNNNNTMINFVTAYYLILHVSKIAADIIIPPFEEVGVYCFANVGQLVCWSVDKTCPINN